MPGAPSAAAGRMVVRAPAKVNLTLDVLGRRPDGYHALRSVMQTLELHVGNADFDTSMSLVTTKRAVDSSGRDTSTVLPGSSVASLKNTAGPAFEST